MISPLFRSWRARNPDADILRTRAGRPFEGLHRQLARRAIVPLSRHVQPIAAATTVTGFGWIDLDPRGRADHMPLRHKDDRSKAQTPPNVPHGE